MTESPLAAYLPRMRDARHRRTVEDLFRWSVAHGRNDVDFHAREAYVAATFSVFCTTPRFTEADDLVCAKYSLVFFLADDSPREQLAEFDRHLGTGAATSDNESAGCFASVLDDLARRGRPTGPLRESCRGWVRAMHAEQALDPAQVDPQTHLSYRRQTIFAPSYVLCARTTLGLALSSAAQGAVDRSPLPDLLTDMIITANDLGSLEVDAVPEHDVGSLVAINSVLLRSRDRSRARAVSQAVARYNRDAATFRDTTRRLLSAHAEPDLADYLALLRGVVNGNLTATRHLEPDRYRGGRAHLRELVMIDE